MPDPIKMQIKADYDGQAVDDAVKDTKKLSDTTDESKKATNRQSESMREATHATKQTGGALGGLAGSIKGMVTGWLSFIAIGAAILGIFKDITDRAKNAATAVADVGKSIRGLVANVGSDNATQIFKSCKRPGS